MNSQRLNEPELINSQRLNEPELMKKPSQRLDEPILGDDLYDLANRLQIEEAFMDAEKGENEEHKQNIQLRDIQRPRNMIGKKAETVLKKFIRERSLKKDKYNKCLDRLKKF